MGEQSQRIGIFGGTFDPVHNGHVAIARSFLNSDEIDALWIILNPTPPHKPEEHPAPYNLRFKMLDATFREVPNVTINNIETRLPPPTYTVQTLRYLHRTHPGYAFKLCMGEDSFLSFKSWFKWEQIVRLCPLIVAERPASSREDMDRKLRKRAIFVDHEPVDVSSTNIRRMIKNGEKVSHLIPSPALQIIREEKLYQ